MPSEASAVSGDQSVEELRRELAEAREQQAATVEILKVISSSPTDLKRVFAEIAMSAARLCDAHDAAIHQIDGDSLPLVAHYGPILVPDSLPLTRGVLAGRAVLDRQTIQVTDLQAETDEYPEGSEIGRRLGLRTDLAVPLIRVGNAIGVVVIRRMEVRPFTERQTELVKTSDQAVIAIENSRLFEAEQARTRELTERTQELTETLEYQTAISDVLSVISRSPSDLQPVLDAIVRSAVKLCDGLYGAVNMFDGEKILRPTAFYNYTPEALAAVERMYPMLPSRRQLTARAILDRAVAHIPDVLGDGDYAPDIALAGGGGAQDSLSRCSGRDTPLGRSSSHARNPGPSQIDRSISWKSSLIRPR